jgi:hypothetical protein
MIYDNKIILITKAKKYLIYHALKSVAHSTTSMQAKVKERESERPTNILDI